MNNNVNNNSRQASQSSSISSNPSANSNNKRHCNKLTEITADTAFAILNTNYEWFVKINHFRQMDANWDQIKISNDNLNDCLKQLDLLFTYCNRCRMHSINMQQIDNNVAKYEMIQTIWDELTHFSHRYLECSGKKITLRTFFEGKNIICGLDLYNDTQIKGRKSYQELEEGYQILPKEIQNIVNEYFFGRVEVSLCINRPTKTFPISLQDIAYNVMACLTNRCYFPALTDFENTLRTTYFLRDPTLVSLATKERIYEVSKEIILRNNGLIPFVRSLTPIEKINHLSIKKKGRRFIRDGELIIKKDIDSKNTYNLLKRIVERLSKDEIHDALFDSLLNDSDLLIDKAPLVDKFFTEVLLPNGIFSSWDFIIKLIDVAHPIVEKILMYAQILNREDILYRCLNYGISFKNPQNLNINLVEKACQFGAKITHHEIEEIRGMINTHAAFKPQQDRGFIRKTINEVLVNLQKYADQNEQNGQEISSKKSQQKTVDFTDAFEVSLEEKEKKEEDILEQSFMANNIAECLYLLNVGMTPSIPFLLKVISAENVEIIKKCVEMSVVFDDACKEKTLSIGNPQITKLILGTEDEFDEDIEEKEGKMKDEVDAEDGWGDFDEADAENTIVSNGNNGWD